MNTFFLRNKKLFSELHTDDQGIILNNLQEAMSSCKCISIRGYMEEMGEVYATLYGCYQLSPKEVSDYYRNGGEWSYLDPAPLYAEFTGGEPRS